MPLYDVVDMNGDDSTANKHGVARKVWAKWSDRRRRAFNDAFATAGDQAVMTHPKAKRIPAEHWATIRWNVAWLAAEKAGSAAP